VLRDPDILF